MSTFQFQGHTLCYEEQGAGERPVVLTHGLLMHRGMHDGLAGRLAERGNRVIQPDLLGHGQSDRPHDLSQYSMPQFGEQLLALLDHLELREAVLGGTSLGANSALEAAVRAPERVRGMVLEMPVLDNALLACALFFAPLLAAYKFGEPVMRAIAAVARRVPRRVPMLPWEDLRTMWLDAYSQDPSNSASLLEGVLFGRSAPSSPERRKIAAPAIVIGHPRDAIHPFSDALMLAEELPNGRLIEADSIAEMWLEPERLTGEISEFLDESWKPRVARGGVQAAS